MSGPRPVTAGATRICPHCRVEILESASICPACRHHLRFHQGHQSTAVPSFIPLRVEGTIHHPDVGEPWEYTVTLVVRNEKGEETSRQVVGVGAVPPAEGRTFSLTVEVFAPDGRGPGGRRVAGT